MLRLRKLCAMGALMLLVSLHTPVTGSAQNAGILSEDIRLNNKGTQYSKKGMLEEAITEFTKAIQLNPTAPAYYINRGNIYAEKGDFKQAISDFNKAIEIDNNGLAYYSRSMVYYKQGLYDEAWDDVHGALEDGFPVYPEFIKMLQDASGREQINDEGSKTNPDVSLALENKANAYFDTGNYDKAIEFYNKALKVTTNPSYVIHDRGMVYLKKRRT